MGRERNIRLDKQTAVDSLIPYSLGLVALTSTRKKDENRYYTMLVAPHQGFSEHLSRCFEPSSISLPSATLRSIQLHQSLKPNTEIAWSLEVDARAVGGIRVGDVLWVQALCTDSVYR